MSDEQQAELCYQAIRACGFAVDNVLIGHPELLQQSGFVRSRVTIAATIAYLVGEGLITVKPLDQWPPWISVEIVPHLQPNVAAVIAGNWSLREQLFPAARGTDGDA